MTQAQFLQNLTTPTGPVDVVLDTDVPLEILRRRTAELYRSWRLSNRKEQA